MITKQCAVSGQDFTVTEEDLKFYESMGVPTPSLCPKERHRRRIFIRNMTNLYRRKCDATDKVIISAYHAEQPFPVYENDYWWSDKWNAMDYGLKVDTSQDINPQYKALIDTVPRAATIHTNCENCDYSNAIIDSKNCYLIFGGVESEDCMYGHIVWNSQNCFDLLYCHRCQWCSNSVDLYECYDTHYSSESLNCSESYFLHDCRNCQNCFGCVNLRNKQYYFLNEPCTKEAYEEKIKAFISFTPDTVQKGKAWFEKMKIEKGVFPEMVGFKNENVSGNHVYNSKNTHYAFDTREAQDCKFMYSVVRHEDCYDISFCGGQLKKRCYQCVTVGNTNNVIGSYFVYDSYDCGYCEFCYNSHDLLFCHGLRNQSFCILNKQYSEEEYHRLKAQIIEGMKARGQWGEFFHPSLSPFAYNETVAQDYLPLTKSQALELGYPWRDDDESSSKYMGEEYLIPHNLAEVDDDILEKILICEETGKYYKLQKAELHFCRKIGIPIPRVHPDIRHQRRMKLRNPQELWNKKCAQSEKPIQTTFAPDRPEKVLCKECYTKALDS